MPDFEPGRLVILGSATPELLKGLPEEDQIAIRAIVGRPVTYVGHTYGQAEIEFVDGSGDGHTIWVEPSLLRPASV
jgi:hypothetical protein